ncbi:MAG: hypothetical protein WCJ01_04685, partial [Ignavibacteria bacterium]
MFFNPLFLQVISNPESATAVKQQKLNGSSYLFSDIIKVCFEKNDTDNTGVNVLNADNINRPFLSQGETIDNLPTDIKLLGNTSAESTYSQLLQQIIPQQMNSQTPAALNFTGIQNTPVTGSLLNENEVNNLITKIFNENFKGRVGVISKVINPEISVVSGNQTVVDSEVNPETLLNLLKNGNAVSLESSSFKKKQGLLISLIAIDNKNNVPVKLADETGSQEDINNSNSDFNSLTVKPGGQIFPLHTFQIFQNFVSTENTSQNKTLYRVEVTPVNDWEQNNAEMNSVPRQNSTISNEQGFSYQPDTQVKKVMQNNSAVKHIFNNYAQTQTTDFAVLNKYGSAKRYVDNAGTVSQGSESGIQFVDSINSNPDASIGNVMVTKEVAESVLNNSTELSNNVFTDNKIENSQVNISKNSKAENSKANNVIPKSSYMLKNTIPLMPYEEYKLIGPNVQGQTFNEVIPDTKQSGVANFVNQKGFEKIAGAEDKLVITENTKQVSTTFLTSDNQVPVKVSDRAKINNKNGFISGKVEKYPLNFSGDQESLLLSNNDYGQNSKTVFNAKVVNSKETIIKSPAVVMTESTKNINKKVILPKAVIDNQPSGQTIIENNGKHVELKIKSTPENKQISNSISIVAGNKQPDIKSEFIKTNNIASIKVNDETIKSEIIDDKAGIKLNTKNISFRHGNEVTQKVKYVKNNGTTTNLKEELSGNNTDNIKSGTVKSQVAINLNVENSEKGIKSYPGKEKIAEYVSKESVDVRPSIDEEPARSLNNLIDESHSIGKNVSTSFEKRNSVQSKASPVSEKNIKIVIDSIKDNDIIDAGIVEVMPEASEKAVPSVTVHAGTPEQSESGSVKP